MHVCRFQCRMQWYQPHLPTRTNSQVTVVNVFSDPWPPRKKIVYFLRKLCHPTNDWRFLHARTASLERLDTKRSERGVARRCRILVTVLNRLATPQRASRHPERVPQRRLSTRLDWETTLEWTEGKAVPTGVLLCSASSTSPGRDSKGSRRSLNRRTVEITAITALQRTLSMEVPGSWNFNWL